MSLRYIAASLGLSVTTVSRALAGYSDVAEETRRKVKAEAERIGYVPNATARRLQKGRSDAIGIAVPGGYEAIADLYLQVAFTNVWMRLSEFDRDIVLLPSNNEAMPTDRDTGPFRRAIEERRIDGLLLVRTRRDDWRLDYLERARVPFVILGSHHSDAQDLAAIGVDDEVAADVVLERLRSFGHRRIALVVPDGEFDFVHVRIEVFRRRAIDHGVEILVAPGRFCEDGGRAVTARILALADRPTAIVYFTNRMAIGGLRAISDSVLVPGRHVSVISYGDGPNLHYASPPITAIRAPLDEMARHAVDVLIARIEGRPLAAIRRWPLTLVRRQSDGPLVPGPATAAEAGRRSALPDTSAEAL